MISSLVVAALLAVQVPASQGKASVSGVVVESGTNRPLARATLELRSGTSASERFPALTDENGVFILRNIPPGRYALTAARNGYLHAELGRRAPDPAGAPPMPGMMPEVSLMSTPATSRLVLAAGQQMTGIRMAMIRAGAVSGHVYGSKGEAVAYAQLTARRISYPDGMRTLTVLESVFTNDIGEYRFFGLPPGQYVISAETGFATQVLMPVGVSTTPPQPGLLVTGSANGGVGYVGDPANQNRNGGGRGVALASGIPTFFRNASNDRDAWVVDVRSGDDLGGIDIAVVPVPLVSVTGAASNPGNGTSLSIVPQPLSGPGGGRGGGRGGAAQLPPGAYTLVGTRVEAGRRLIGIAPFDVNAGSPPLNPVVTLNPTLEVSGRVVLEPGMPEIDLAKVSVRFKRLGEISGLPEPSQTPNANGGAFTFYDFIDGDYAIEVAGWPASLTDAHVRAIAVNGEPLGETLQVRGGPVTGVEIRIGRGGGQLDGFALGSNRQREAGVLAVLVPDLRGRRDLYRTATTDAEGRFHLEGIEAGGYKVFAWEQVEAGAWHSVEFLRLHEARGVAVNIGGASGPPVEVPLIPFQ